MATSVTLNGTTYQIPAEGDFNWGTELSNYFIAISTSVLQKTGGTFTLTSEVNFGATYGVKSAYLKSQAANPASAGVIRLGNAENISWRNQANNGDLALTVNASNQLAYNGTKVILSGAIVNADVDAAAAIAYSKLNLSGSIVDADVNASAAIAVSKLAAVTASRLLVSDASGFLSASSVTSTEAGYLSGVTSAIQTQLNAKAPSASPTFTGTVTLPATVTGASAQVLTLPTSTSTLATLALTENLTNKTLDNSNTITVRDDRFTIQDNSDPTKQVNFQLSGITTGTTRTITVADANIEIGKAPTVQRFTSGSGTYTTPAGVRYIVVEMVGGGGGGGGSGTTDGTAATAGGNTTFGSSLLTANGGAAGARGATATAGGSATVNSPAVALIAVDGGAGNGAFRQNSAASTQSPFIAGGMGGVSAFGGAGGGSLSANNGTAATANSGSGGGGAGQNATANAQAGNGGGAGAYIKAMITSPSATYAYAVGAAGSGQAAGTSGNAGGNGGSGVIVVTEYYN